MCVCGYGCVGVCECVWVCGCICRFLSLAGMRCAVYRGALCGNTVRDICRRLSLAGMRC